MKIHFSVFFNIDPSILEDNGGGVIIPIIVNKDKEPQKIN